MTVGIGAVADHSGWRGLSRSAVVLRLQALLAEHFKKKRAFQPTPRPIVSFTFDDFPRSALTTGGEILGEFGARGTYYTSMGLLGGHTAVGEMFNWDDLERLVAAGHELACHTLDHTLSTDATPSQLLAVCAQNRRRIAAVDGGCRLCNFSFPEGVVTLRAKAALGAVYATCRTIEPGINGDPVDLAFLRANRLYAVSSASEMHELLQKNEQEKGWAIFYAHDVSPIPSPYGCKPGQFREIVRRAVDSCAEILTIREALSRFRLGDERHG